jgi:hypothetical protein
MTKVITNITLITVKEQVEKVLETYPDRPYQQAFAIPQLRQKLIAYVLSRVANCYTVVEEGEETNNKLAYCDADKRSTIETLVSQGIGQVLNQEPDYIHYIPEEIDPGYAPSDWFG